MNCKISEISIRTSGCNEGLNAVGGEGQEHITKIRNIELAKIMHLRLVLKELGRMRILSIDIPDPKPVKYALKVISVGDFLRLGDKGDHLLDLGELRSVNLTYTERKAVRQQLTVNLKATLQRVVEFSRKLRTECPDAFVTTTPSIQTILETSENNAAYSKPQPAITQILVLEAKRRKNLEKLIELSERKCGLLKSVAELKMGPYLGHELELLLTEAKKNQMKANVLRHFFINDLVTRDEHSVKAIKQVEGYIDEEIEQLDKDNATNR